MVDERPRRRVLLLFETHWDRKQLAACAPRWSERIEVAFPEPNDVDCPYAFDPLAYIEDAAAGGLGPVGGVLSSSDYPGATVAAALATRLGLSGPRPERVLGASHKYYSRLAQRRAAPEAVPPFAAVDSRAPEPPPELAFPLFVKPVKGAFSVLARRVEDAAGLAAFLGSPAVREFTADYMAVFNRLVSAFTDFAIDGHWFIAEGLLSGELVTVEGFVCDGRVEVFGIVDSMLHPNGSFKSFDYPSRLPAPVQERMAEIAARTVRELGLDRCLFNIEMVREPGSGHIAIIEVNPRICGQFADLYQKVDGTNSYERALALACGEEPRFPRGAGRYACASSVPLRVFEPMHVRAAPSAADVAAAEALFPETLVWSECETGDELADFDVDEDGASHRYAVVNLGGASRTDLSRRLEAVQERLAYRMEPRQSP